MSADATPQKIDFGTKVTGQAGAQDVGLLHVRTGEDDGFSSEDLTVARVKRRVWRQSYVGGLYTRRDPRLGDVSATHMVGLDARLATSTFLRDQNIEGSGWFLYNSQPGSSGGNGAFGASLLYPNDLWNARIDATEVQENFDSTIGFVSRRAYRQYSQAVEFGPRPANHRYIRQVTVGARLDTLTDLNCPRATSPRACTGLSARRSGPRSSRSRTTSSTIRKAASLAGSRASAGS